MNRRDLAWLTIVMLLFAVCVAAFAGVIGIEALYREGIVRHEPPDWLALLTGSAIKAAE